MTQRVSGHYRVVKKYGVRRKIYVKEYQRRGKARDTHKAGYYLGKKLTPDDYYRCHKCNTTKNVSEFPTEENICGKCYSKYFVAIGSDIDAGGGSTIDLHFDLDNNEFVESKYLPGDPEPLISRIHVDDFDSRLYGLIDDEVYDAIEKRS